jgi:predicted NAD/FAD-dependent oxidoreductase
VTAGGNKATQRRLASDRVIVRRPCFCTGVTGRNASRRSARGSADLGAVACRVVSRTRGVIAREEWISLLAHRALTGPAIST